MLVAAKTKPTGVSTTWRCPGLWWSLAFGPKRVGPLNAQLKNIL